MGNITKLLLTSAMAAYAMSALAFSGGTGTEADPFKIATASDLQQVTDYAGVTGYYFKVVNDIDLTDYIAEQAWQPIGDLMSVFDGNNQVISGLTISNGVNNAALFSQLHQPGVIKNVIIKNADIVAGNWSGILVGAAGNWERSGGLIENCRIYDSFIEGGDCIGAIAGVAENTIRNCVVYNVEISATGAAGGIAGFAQSRGAGTQSINDCMFYGSVTGGNKVGGIAGMFSYPESSSAYSFYNNTVYGTVVGVEAVGGLVGYQQGQRNIHIDNNMCCAFVTGYQVGGIGGSPIDGVVNNCYAMGDVVGLTGDMPWNGGICGTAYNTISNCYFAGALTGEGEKQFLGAICGRDWQVANPLILFNNYFDADKSTKAFGENSEPESYGKGMLAEEMMSLSTMVFTNPEKWQCQDGLTYPYFANQTAPIVITSCDDAGAKGTYYGQEAPTEMFCWGAITGGMGDATFTAADGQWSITWGEDGIIPKDEIFIVAKVGDKMPSYVVSAVATEGGEVPVLGDITGDGFVDIDDINAIINMLLGKSEKTAAGDVTNDGYLDIDDVNALINIMLGK